MLPDDAEGRCLAARRRAEGGPLTDDEVMAYLGWLADERMADDPLDPPSYDWGCGGPVAGGSQMQVAREAAALLRKRGGDALARHLADRLRVPGDRVRAARLAVELLGAAHPLVKATLTHGEPGAREAIAEGFARQPFLGPDAPPTLVLGLFDEREAVVRDVVAALDRAIGGSEQAVAALPPDAFARARHPDARIALAALTGRWGEAALTPADCARVVARKAVSTPQIEALLATQPDLAAPLLAAVRARFEAAPAGRRYEATAQLAAFAPDAAAFALVLAEVRARSSAVDAAVCFVARAPALLQPTIDALLAGMSEDQHTALGVRALIRLDPKAFGAAFPREQRARLRKVLRNLPNVLEADTLLASLDAPA
ncbi:MAG: hypothetical protein AB1730_15295 [Myxococcota bacterium]|jgi:hypothetical protein